MKNVNWRCTRHTPGEPPQNFYREKIGDKILEFLRVDDTYTLNRIYYERYLIVAVQVPCINGKHPDYKDINMKIEVSLKDTCGTFPVYLKGGKRVEKAF
jgi:hypothetical protein